MDKKNFDPEKYPFQQETDFFLSKCTATESQKH
jgi:hypothetical protein